MVLEKKMASPVKPALIDLSLDHVGARAKSLRDVGPRIMTKKTAFSGKYVPKPFEGDVRGIEAVKGHEEMPSGFPYVCERAVFARRTEKGKEDLEDEGSIREMVPIPGVIGF